MPNFKPKHHLGQNFLQDEEVLKKIVDAADLKSSDTVLEIGPGLGVLTKELVAKVSQVVAVEKDTKLILHLEKEFNNNKKLKLVNEDILRFHLKKNLPKEYKVVANIPYYLTSKLLQNFLESDHPPKTMVLMVQKEVGERLVAKPGGLSILGISVQIYSDVEIVDRVSRQSFWPVPEVDSVIIKITPKDKYLEIEDKRLFFRIVKTAFSGKRKQIKNTIRDSDILWQAGIDQTLRPQDLSLDDWISLYKTCKEKNFVL